MKLYFFKFIFSLHLNVRVITLVNGKLNLSASTKTGNILFPDIIYIKLNRSQCMYVCMCVSVSICLSASQHSVFSEIIVSFFYLKSALKSQWYRSYSYFVFSPEAGVLKTLLISVCLTVWILVFSPQSSSLQAAGAYLFTTCPGAVNDYAIQLMYFNYSGDILLCIVRPNMQELTAAFS